MLKLTGLLLGGEVALNWPKDRCGQMEVRCNGILGDGEEQGTSQCFHKTKTGTT